MPSQRLHHLFELSNPKKLSAEDHSELMSLMANSANEAEVKELMEPLLYRSKKFQIGHKTVRRLSVASTVSLYKK